MTDRQKRDPFAERLIGELQNHGADVPFLPPPNGLTIDLEEACRLLLAIAEMQDDQLYEMAKGGE